MTRFTPTGRGGTYCAPWVVAALLKCSVAEAGRRINMIRGRPASRPVRAVNTRTMMACVASRYEWENCFPPTRRPVPLFQWFLWNRHFARHRTCILIQPKHVLLYSRGRALDNWTRKWVTEEEYMRELNRFEILTDPVTAFLILKRRRKPIGWPLDV